MKEIKAYIRLDRIDFVIEQLEQAGVTGMTIINTNAIAEWADKESYRFSIEYVEKYSTVAKIELICTDDQVEKLIPVIVDAGHTGNSGDGWIFVSPIEKAIRIKTKSEVNNI